MTTSNRIPIRLAGFDFDPLQDEMPVAKEPLAREASDRPPYIVQFRQSPTLSDRQRVQTEYGLRLTDYIPELSYLERLDAATVERLASSSLVRAVVPYYSRLKLSSTIGETRFRTSERLAIAGVWVSIALFSDAEPERVVKLARELEAKRIRVNDDRRFGGGVVVTCVLPSPEAARRIAALDDVRSIEEVPEPIEDNVRAAATNQSRAAGNPVIWDQGLHGEDQVIGIIDTGPLDIDHCFFRDPANNRPRRTHRKVLEIRNRTGGMVADSHATFTSGCAAGDDFNNPGAAARRGGAWAARLVSGNRFDIPGRASMLAELNAAADKSAHIHSNSWHDNTTGPGSPAPYNQTAADVDTFTWNNEDHLVLGSAGNLGNEQGPPGTAKNAICVGAAKADPNEMEFGNGNSGPTADDRRKPDLMGVGCDIESSISGTICGTGPGSPCATSYATPHVAAAAALVRQYFAEGLYPTTARTPGNERTASGALLKAILVNSTIPMTGIAGYPSDLGGWGLIVLSRVLAFGSAIRILRVWDRRHVNGLTTGVTDVHHIAVATSNRPLKVVLAWTDAPAIVHAVPAAVNHLNLRVESPNGTRYRGNFFVDGVSEPGGVDDTVNNVEVVLVKNPSPGNWTMRVIGTQVNMVNPRQGYAVAATADMA